MAGSPLSGPKQCPRRHISHVIQRSKESQYGMVTFVVLIRYRSVQQKVSVFCGDPPCGREPTQQTIELRSKSRTRRGSFEKGNWHFPAMLKRSALRPKTYEGPRNNPKGVFFKFILIDLKLDFFIVYGLMCFLETTISRLRVVRPFRAFYFPRPF